jgi:hypothetical protein
MPEMEKKHLMLIIIKWFGYLLCGSVFLIQVGIVWSQYLQESTVTSTSNVKSEKKVLPCLTFCPYPVFKKPVYPLTNEEFETNAYQWEDVFSNKTLEEFNQTNNWKVYKTSGPLTGNCFTTCQLNPVAAFELSRVYYLRKGIDLTVYIHNPGKYILFS